MLSRAGHYLLSIVTVVLFYWIIGLYAIFLDTCDGEGNAARNSLRKQLQDWPRLHFLTRTDRIVSALQQNPWVDKVLHLSRLTVACVYACPTNSQ